jgi:uncharacterized membrane protein
MAEAPKNLIVSRSQPSVWDRQSLSSTITAYDQERWMTAAWGSALAIIGGRRGGFTGGLLATFGAAMAVRAAMGRHDVAMARHWVEAQMRARGWRAEDIVHQTSDESFPASDAPSWTPTEGAARR